MAGLLPSALQLRLRLGEARELLNGLNTLTAAALLLPVLIWLMSALTSRKSRAAAAGPPSDFSGEWLNVSLEGDAHAFYGSIGLSDDSLERFAADSFGVGKITHAIEMDAARLQTKINFPTEVTVCHVLDGCEHSHAPRRGAAGTERYSATWESCGSLLVTRAPPNYDFRRSLQGDRMVLEMFTGDGLRLVRTFVRR